MVFRVTGCLARCDPVALLTRDSVPPVDLFECDGDKCGLSSSRILHIRYEEEGCMRCHFCLCIGVVAEAVVALSQHIDGSALRSIYSALQRAYDVGNGEHGVGTVQAVIRYILRGSCIVVTIHDDRFNICISHYHYRHALGNNLA